MMTLRERNRELQRTRILQAARDRFAADGFDAVTVADVAEAAGVARATVFNHFRSKRGLVEALTQQVQLSYHEMLGTALADESTPTPVLILALFEQMGSGIELDRQFFRGVFQEFARSQVGIDEDGEAYRNHEAAVRRLTELVERGQSRGDLTRTQSSVVVADALTSLANGTITRWLYDDASEPLVVRMRAAALTLLEPVADGMVALDHERPLLGPDHHLETIT